MRVQAGEPRAEQEARRRRMEGTHRTTAAAQRQANNHSLHCLIKFICGVQLGACDQQIEKGRRNDKSQAESRAGSCLSGCCWELFVVRFSLLLVCADGDEAAVGQFGASVLRAGQQKPRGLRLFLLFNDDFANVCCRSRRCVGRWSVS